MPPLTDVHVHLAALPTASNGCLLSRKMRSSPLTHLISRSQGLPLEEPERANEIYLQRLRAELGRSRRVSRAVLLPMDGAYDASGRLDEAATDFLISNDAVHAAAGGALLPGASINPARRDAIEELERCAARGAALVKVLPNAQGFDPAEPRFRPFYRALGRLKIPLLSHVGYEFSLIGKDQSAGDPLKLIPALEEGATVIAAHGCSAGLFFLEPHLKTMARLAAGYPRFFADLSALTLPNRFGALLRLRRRPELFDRLLFGTDYPLACFSWAVPGARGCDNRFDRQAAVLEGLGLPAGRDVAGLLGPGC